MAATILIVDDDAYVRRTVERILTRAHYDVVTAGDVQEAVRYAQRIPMDSAIVDFHLPDADGLQVLSRLRDLQPGCVRILMTGMHDYKMVVDAVNRGEVSRVIIKPFDSAGLLQTLQDAFHSAQVKQKFAISQTQAVRFQELRMLNDCLEGDLLRLAVQPIVHAQDPGHIFAYEALLRSHHPQLDGPLAVLKVAESHDKLFDVGARVFQLAAGWLDKLPQDQHLFVNLSAEQLGNAERIAQDLEPLLPHAQRVVLEITEQSHLIAIDGWDKSADYLRGQGFELAVDDLGAGYNSLAILADVQPTFVKLDMSLVRDVHLNDHRRRVVEMVVQLAEATQARIVAEGVECAEEAEVLRGLGCHLLQGYHFAKPSLELPNLKAGSTEAA